jgi:antitoxin VapB
MSLNIKNAETYRLVKELADATGESMTAAVTEAVRERLERLRASGADSDAEVEARIQRMEAIAAVIRGQSPPGYWDQDFDALLYDDLGLPR